MPFEDDIISAYSTLVLNTLKETKLTFTKFIEEYFKTDNIDDFDKYEFI